MGKIVKVDKTIQKNISIKERHEELIKKRYLNLSRFVQDKLDELIKDD